MFIHLFITISKKTVQLVHSKKELACDLIGSWTVAVGDVDQCVHLWRYTGGFEKIDKAHRELYGDKVWIKDSNMLFLKINNGNFHPIYRIMQSLRKNVANCCARVICNICWRSVIGRKLLPAKKITFMKCVRIVWNPAPWLNGAIIGLEEFSSARATMKRMPDFSHKSVVSTMFITSGVGFMLWFIRNKKMINFSYIPL